MAQVNPLIAEKVRRFLAELSRNGIRVEAAYLFGSYARGRENRWSDIDVAVISPDISADRYEERVRLMKIASSIDCRIEPAPFNIDAFADEDPLAWEVKRNGILFI